MLNKACSVLLCVQCVWAVFVEDTPVVEVQQGRLTGVRSLLGQNQYYGIPYASSKRFQPPTPPPKWNGVFRAEDRFVSCAQAIESIHVGVEDCLRLDVYTPRHAIRGLNLPVLLFFHGGAYYNGAKWFFDPEYLVNKNVIVVLANYRLGVLGFLCLNNVANLGLKDQLAALKWVHKNIAAFGGDPDNVTLGGQSAGSVSTSLHMLSKHSRGLFHKALLMSGVALTPWAFNPDPLTPAFEDAAKISSRVTNEQDVYETFLKAPLEELLTATQGTLIDPKYFKYSPCGDFNLTDPFFHDTPYNIIKSGDFNKVPMIIGLTNLEGLMFYALNNQKSLQYLDDTFPDRLPSTFSWCSHKDKVRIANKFRSYYFGKKRIISKSSIKGGVDFYSDWIAYSAINAFSQLMTKYSDKPVYNYLFTYEGRLNFAKFLVDTGFSLKGATHCDDLAYLFKPFGLSLIINNKESLLIERFTTMVTNFMKFGNPTPVTSKLLPVRWPVTSVNRSQVLRIDSRLSVSDTPAHVTGLFMLDLLCEHGLSGYVPCDSAMRCNLD